VKKYRRSGSGGQGVEESGVSVSLESPSPRILELIVALITLATQSVFAFVQPVCARADPPVKLAVTHFENRTTSSSLDYLTQQIPEMIVSELARHDGLVLLERERSDRFLEELREVRGDSSVVFAADVLLTGSFAWLEDQLVLRFQLVDLRSSPDSAPIHSDSRMVDIDRLDSMAEDIARQAARLLGSRRLKRKEVAIPLSGNVFRLAVLYLNDNSPLAERLALEKGLADIIIHSLDGVPNIEVLEREEISRLVEEREVAGRDVGVSEGLLSELDALVLGTYMVQSGGSFLRVDVRVVAPQTGLILDARNFIWPRDGLNALETQIRDWILSVINVPAPALVHRVGSAHLEAIHYYSLALDHIDSGNFLEAVRAI